MAERDRFELDLAAAVRAYLEDAPTQVRPTELARQFATAYPHGRTALARWGFGRTPAMAWALLLLAALLAALTGGTLLVGSQLQRTLPAVVPPVGQLFECPPGSTSDEPGPVDQARPLAEKLERSAMALDRRAGRLVALTNAGDGVETWTFDLCTNTWAQMHPSREPASFEWAELVYDIDSDATILVATDSGAVRVWAYDLRADTWTEMGAGPADGALFLAYDPASGLVVAAEHSDRKMLWTYDVETDWWTMIHQANAGPDNAAIAYDASVDRLVAYGDGAGGSPPYETWLFDLPTGTWSGSAAERPAVVAWLVAPGIVYDEAAERTVIFRRSPLTAYDASADRWEILAEATTVGPARMAYDPVNRRLVGWGDKTWGPTGAVEALDLVTGEWTVLLAPSEGQPAPSSE